MKIKKIFKVLIKIIKKPSSTQNYLKLYFISNMKRYKISKTNLFNVPFKFIDSASFISQYNEIFDAEIYKFKTNALKPYIIDGGANIGLSVIYFKKMYPSAKIISFEPDENIFKILKENIASFKLKNIEMINKGLWNKEDKLSFFSDGADSGRIVSKNTNDKKNISTLSLRPYLNKKVDFLKLDIEGAEAIVLDDCKDLLINVENLFLEYHSFKSNKQTLGKIINIISDSGFRYYIESIGVDSKNPFIYINSYLDMDLQLNIYAYRN